jgi:hypothetical protein
MMGFCEVVAYGFGFWVMRMTLCYSVTVRPSVSRSVSVVTPDAV